jgi:hypothetical protein
MSAGEVGKICREEKSNPAKIASLETGLCGVGTLSDVLKAADCRSRAKQKLSANGSDYFLTAALCP